MSDINDQSNSAPAPQPLLTVEDVAKWRAELAEIDRVIADAQARAAPLKKKLEMAAFFMPENVQSPLQVRASPGVGKSSSLYEAIKKAVEKSGATPLTPKMIREAISAGPDASLIGSENYLYTAIKRIADKGDIIKEGAGYVAAVFG